MPARDPINDRAAGFDNHLLEQAPPVYRKQLYKVEVEIEFL